jgi:hypothetical protein
MFRIDLGKEISPGIFAYRFLLSGETVEGRSRQPLLDACRQIKRMGGDTSMPAGLFREGQTIPDLTCGVEWGATHTVAETTLNGPRFRRWEAFDREAVFGN